MYRALTLKAVNKKVDLNNQEALVQLARRVDIQFKIQNDSLQVFLDGKDVSSAIRQQSLTEKVYYIAALKDVRQQMVKLQRRLARSAQGAVLEGRDIGTVVFPNAQYKFYLDAQPDERTRRRFKELRNMGQAVRINQIAQDIELRDQSDMTREVAPLAKAKDAIYIDTTGLSVQNVVEKIIGQCSI